MTGQTPIVVSESTVKVGIMAEEIFYFGFAEGDKMIFSFDEEKGRDMKEIEIVELPSSSRFLAGKTSKINNKEIQVFKTGIYKFRFTNNTILPRVCKYKILRIPASAATQNFNPVVYNEMVNDTTYTFELEDYLEKIDTIFTNFRERLLRVEPSTITSGNKATFNFLLPPATIAWSYYISAGKEGLQLYEEANKSLLAVSSQVIEKFPYYNILCAVALGRPATIPKIEKGTMINFWIMDADNAALFNSGSQFSFIKNGKAVNDYSRMEPPKGNLHFGFTNDNPEAVNLTIKITSVHVNEIWATRQNKKMIISSRNKMILKN